MSLIDNFKNASGLQKIIMTALLAGSGALLTLGTCNNLNYNSSESTVEERKKKPETYEIKEPQNEDGKYLLKFSNHEVPLSKVALDCLNTVKDGLEKDYRRELKERNMKGFDPYQILQLVRIVDDKKNYPQDAGEITELNARTALATYRQEGKSAFKIDLGPIPRISFAELEREYDKADAAAKRHFNSSKFREVQQKSWNQTYNKSMNYRHQHK